MRRYRIILVFSVVGFLLPVALALATGEGLPRALVSSGGGLVSGEGLQLRATIGQPLAGAVRAELALCSGFMCGPGAPARAAEIYSIYVPAVRQ